MARPGPLNLITDVPGITVGNATDSMNGTGVTAVLLDRAWPAAADVRGGGPGVRETETLAAENLVGRADGIVLSGGSVFGLAAADGVVLALAEAGRGLRLREGAAVIPIVPAAVLFDLGGQKRVGSAGSKVDYRALGRQAVAAAGSLFELGSVGAGTGARAGLGKGGLGSASVALANGMQVGALAAVNAIGSPMMGDGEVFWAWPFECDDEFGGRRPATHPRDGLDVAADLSRLRTLGRLQPGVATTLGVVAVSAALTTAECKRLAIMAQDGVARARSVRRIRRSTVIACLRWPTVCRYPQS